MCAPAHLQTACVFGAGNPEGSHFAHRLRRCIDNVQLLPIMGFKNHNTIAYLRMERKLNAFYQMFVDAIFAGSDFADGFRNAVDPGPVPDTGERAASHDGASVTRLGFFSSSGNCLSATPK